MSTQLPRPSLFAAQIAACLLLVACAGKRPPTHVWTLRAVPQAEASATAGSEVTLGLQNFTAEAALRSTNLSWREGKGGKLQHYPYNEWLDYPDVILFALTKAALVSAGSTVKPSPPRQGMDAILACRLMEFDEWDSKDNVQVRLRLSWQLEHPDGTPLAEGTSERRLAAKTKDVEAVVAAFEKAANQVVQEVVRDALAALGESRSKGVNQD